ncbi:MAG TPA: DUF2079 domain-containing protein [Ktedonobacterales bacterium]|jgi:uncharacterized membrane protein|nr:DUF2079 domain-containing protein [Ktedonobacterales bacterium]
MSVTSQQAPASSPSGARRLWRWILAHEDEPAPYDAGRAGRYALIVVALAAIAYTVILTLYTAGLHDTFATHAEDLGIMDQALWNTAHGHFLYETICNPIGDLNCTGGVVRFAIHFEPILIPLSLIYLVAPHVKLLLFLQALVVASGAFPAYLLATRRMRHPLWGLLIAGLFLVYPPLTAAVVDDFHPEVFAATILLWAWYFLTLRRYRALVLCLLLALLCKETMTLDVIAIGLFVALFHRRMRLGLGIVVMGALTLILALALMRVFSPLGHSPVTGRFSTLLHAPAQTLLAMAHDPARRGYLLKLLGPLGFLPLLAPWVAIVALPSVALNLLSSDPLMYSGLYQYNTDIAAVLVIATVDALAWVAPDISHAFVAGRSRLRATHAPGWLVAIVRPQSLIVVALIPVLVVGLGGQATRVYQQLTVRHIWPVVTQHDLLGDHIAAEIPAGASVSAQSTLAPHVSQRETIYQFPSGVDQADYLFLDVTTGNFYPFTNSSDYVAAVRQALNSGGFGLVAAQDGYLLLKRGGGSPVANGDLSGSFTSFARTAWPLAGVQMVDATFAGGLQLVGYQINPPQVYRVEPELTVTTYWRVTKPISQPQTVVMTLVKPSGSRLVFADSLTQEWLPPSDFVPGAVYRMQTWPIYLDANGPRVYTLGVEVRDGAPDTQPPSTAAVAATLSTPAGESGFPRLAQGGASALLTSVPLR